MPRLARVVVPEGGKGSGTFSAFGACDLVDGDSGHRVLRPKPADGPWRFQVPGSRCQGSEKIPQRVPGTRNLQPGTAFSRPFGTKTRPDFTPFVPDPFS